MEIFLDIISKVVVMFLIYFIIGRALGGIGFRKRAIIIFVIGFILSGIFFLAYILDLKYGTMIGEYNYLSYIIINLGFGLIFLIYNITKYPKNNFSKYNYKRNKTFERKSKVFYKEFLYILFEYKNEYLFKKYKENYYGLNMPLKKGKFQDEELKSFLDKYKASGSKVNLFGKYIDSHKKQIYHVYLINLDNEIDVKNYQYIHSSKIRYLDMLDFDKEIVYRILLNEKFNIER